jgi:hypothetical protein
LVLAFSNAAVKVGRGAASAFLPLVISSAPARHRQPGIRISLVPLVKDYFVIAHA